MHILFLSAQVRWRIHIKAFVLNKLPERLIGHLRYVDTRRFIVDFFNKHFLAFFCFVDFIIPLTGYMCTVCHQTLDDDDEALKHMNGYQHMKNTEYHRSKFGEF